MKILAEDTMALMIDLQEKLVPVIQDYDKLISNAGTLVKGLRALDIPMVVTQQYTKGIGMTVPVLRDIIGEKFSYTDKLTFSCVQNEEIMEQIKASGRKNIVIFGIEAHICVLQTVIDLLELGYHVILVEDCVGSRRESDCLTGKKRALMEGAIPTSYEAILFELTRAARTDVFKQISNLIK